MREYTSINLADYVHPIDKKMMDTIYSSTELAEVINEICNSDVIETYEYIYKMSYAKIPCEHLVYSYLEEACGIFGVDESISIYIKRSYDYDVECVGYKNPIMVIPSGLLKDGNADILRVRIFAAVASIKAEHHKLLFLLWVIENVGKTIPIPGANLILSGALYEWNRCRTYTTDRAALISTGDLKLTLKNILYGIAPSEVLEKFEFSLTDDTFEEQVEEFMANDKKFIDAIAKLYGTLQYENWHPKRYREVKDFYNKIRGGMR